MGMSKADLTRKDKNLVRALAELEEKAKMDPLKKDWKLHDRIAELKKKLE
ncbi:MAG: hypothetical protein AABX01_07175 [Candidatus Micrarchaeota archaeon]|jgi:hypothetical protein